MTKEKIKMEWITVKKFITILDQTTGQEQYKQNIVINEHEIKMGPNMNTIGATE